MTQVNRLQFVLRAKLGLDSNVGDAHAVANPKPQSVADLATAIASHIDHSADDILAAVNTKAAAQLAQLHDALTALKRADLLVAEATVERNTMKLGVQALVAGLLG